VGHELVALKRGDQMHASEFKLRFRTFDQKSTIMTPDANAIADCVLEAFDRLPEKRKPRSRNDASREWVPLAGIVMCKGNCSLAITTERICTYLCS